LNVGPAYSFAMGNGVMLGASLLAGVAVLLMAITIIGMPAAIYFAVRWSFILQAASLERCGPKSALARSSDLVQDSWWRVSVILLGVIFLVAVGNSFVSLVLDVIPYVGPVVAAILVAPVMIIAQTLLYHDLRVRADTPGGYDLEVLAEELQR